MSKTQTTREMLASHIKRLKTRRAELAEAMAKRAEWFILDLQCDVAGLRAGGKRPVNSLGRFQGNAASFDVQCAELCGLDQEIEELEAIMEISE